jgi:hypothetical protein
MHMWQYEPEDAEEIMTHYDVAVGTQNSVTVQNKHKLITGQVSMCINISGGRLNSCSCYPYLYPIIYLSHRKVCAKMNHITVLSSPSK